MQNSAQNMYQIWRDILNNLFDMNSKFYKRRVEAYRENLLKKVCESIIRFSGQWDIDIFENEEKQRNKLVHQIRNQDREFFKTLKSTNGFKMFTAAN